MSDAAFRVYVRCMSYAADMPRGQITGFLTEVELRAQGATPKVTADLVGLNAFERVQGGVLIHDFEDYLPKNSTAKVKAWREAKRAQMQPLGNPDATVTHIKDEGYSAVTEGTGNGHSHARVDPEPEPVPGVLKAPPFPPKRQRGLGDASEKGYYDDATYELAIGMSEVLGRTLSQLELIECQGALNQYAYLTAAELIDRAKRHVEHCQDSEPKLPLPRTVPGFANTWRLENDHRADKGMPKAQRVQVGRTSGLTRIGELTKELLP